MPGYFNRRVDELRSVFRLRAFRLFSVGNFSSLMAIWIVRVCVGWLTWELTHSKTWLGVMAFAELGPSVFVSLFAGHLADTRDRWKILRFGQSIQTMLAVALVILFAADLLTVWWMVGIMLGYSVIGGLNLPARLSVAPSLVPRDKLATASAVGSMVFNTTRLLGPLVAAPLLAINFEVGAFALATIGFAINTWCLSQVRAEDLVGTPGDKVQANTQSAGFREVLADVFKDRALALVLFVQFVACLMLRPLTEMFPAFSDLIFARGEYGYAALSAAVGIGAVIGALFVVGEMAGRAMRYHILIGSLVLALTGIAFSLTGSFWLALLILGLHGAALTSSGVASTTFVQVRIPTERLGRVMSIYSIIFRLAPAVGALALGLIADLFGLQPSTAAFAIIGVALFALAWRPLIAETQSKSRPNSNPPAG